MGRLSPRPACPLDVGILLVTRFDQIEHACLTDVGVRRSHNQDNYAIQLAGDDEGWKQRGHLFVVADGMGGHAVGEKAAEQASYTIPHIYQKHAGQGPVQALRKAFVEANATIHACGEQNHEFHGMGTTATALLLRPDGAWVGHVGDSRCYRIRGGVIEQLSFDHSHIWEYARLQHMDPDEVEDFPSNLISRCLGPEALVQVDVEGPHGIEPGDVFLLCSDGLSGQVTDQEIGAVAEALPPAEACRFLVDLSNLRGGPDNITVLIVRIGSGGASAGPGKAPASGVPAYPLVLVGGIVLTIMASLLMRSGWQWLANTAFAAAVCAVAGGLIGFFVHYRQERKRVAEGHVGRPPAKPHRRRACRVERALSGRIRTALLALEARASESGWGADWGVVAEHKATGETLHAAGEWGGAFREFCRALLPLTRALSGHRKAGEDFRPVWDKVR